MSIWSIQLFLFGMLAGYFVSFREMIKSIKRDPDMWIEMLHRVKEND